MPDEPVKSSQSDGVGTPSPRELELEKQLKDISAKVDQSAVVHKLLADPEIQKILDAKAAGKSVTVGVEDKTAEDPFADLFADEDKKKDLNVMPNDELLKTLSGKIEAVVSQAVESAVAPLKQKLEKSEEAQADGAMRQSINDAVKLYGEDFYKRKDAMTSLSVDPRYASLNAIELYRLASAEDREKELLTLRKRLSAAGDSEHPTYFTGREIKAPEKTRPGARGFQAMIDEAFKKRQ